MFTQLLRVLKMCVMSCSGLASEPSLEWYSLGMAEFNVVFA